MVTPQLARAGLRSGSEQNFDWHYTAIISVNQTAFS
jgi:hypothetical protein